DLPRQGHEAATQREENPDRGVRDETPWRSRRRSPQSEQHVGSHIARTGQWLRRVAGKLRRYFCLLTPFEALETVNHTRDACQDSQQSLATQVGGKGRKGKRGKGEEGRKGKRGQGEKGKRERGGKGEAAIGGSQSVSPLSLFPFSPLHLFPSSSLTQISQE